MDYPIRFIQTKNFELRCVVGPAATQGQKRDFFLNVIVEFVPGTGEFDHVPARNSDRYMTPPPELWDFLVTCVTFRQNGV